MRAGRRQLFRLMHCSIILLPVLALFFCSSTCFGLTVDRALAVVNGEVITFTDYGSFVARTDQTADRETVSEQYLKTLLEERLILQEAKRKGYDATAEEVSQSIASFLEQAGIQQNEFEKKIALENMSMSDYRTLVKENIISLKCIEKEVNAKVLVSSSDLVRYYEKHRVRFMESPEKVLVMAIVMKLSSNPSLTEITDLKIRSLKVYSEIKNGESFERQVYKYADESVKNLGGILGEFEKGALIPVLDEKIFSMKTGEVSEPIWTKDGVYILKIAKRTAAVYTPLDRVKTELQAKAYEEKREEAFNLWMKKLWERSSIKILQQ
ncbi:MAG: peptidylprolyl isomerase [Nitrospirae bacterium]|nr:peptidylprolyl isomerase [Nitrospirota bacterium]